MYRVSAVIGAALFLAACSSDSDVFKNTDWFKSGSFRMEPVLETVRFESEPPGADAKTSTGQSCRTPCALALPGNNAFDVTYTLAGFQPDVEKVTPFAIGDGTTKLRPNPVLAELTPLPPTKKVRKKRHMVHKRKAAANHAAKPVAHKRANPGVKPAAKSAAAPVAKPAAPPPMTQQPAQAPSPWPAAPPPPRQ
jgi:hypothetical protein